MVNTLVSIYNVYKLWAMEDNFGWVISKEAKRLQFDIVPHKGKLVSIGLH